MFMQISDLFGQYDQNTAVNSQGTGNATGVSGTNPTLAQAMRMLPAGSVFEATVNEMENGEVLLGLSDGRNVSARLSAGVSLNVGESMFFQVKSNNGMQIEIRPFQTGPEGNPTLLKALDAAGLNVNDKNLTLVNTMMQEQMPIDKSSLMAMVRLSGSHQNVAPATLVEMTKLGLPVTEENAAAFENYKTDQNAMMKELNTLFETLPEMAGNEKMSFSDAIAFHKEITAMLADTETAGSVTVKGQEASQTAETVAENGTIQTAEAATENGAAQTTEEAAENGAPQTAKATETVIESGTAQTAEAGAENGTAQTAQAAETIAETGAVRGLKVGIRGAFGQRYRHFQTYAKAIPDRIERAACGWRRWQRTYGAKTVCRKVLPAGAPQCSRGRVALKAAGYQRFRKNERILRAGGSSDGTAVADPRGSGRKRTDRAGGIGSFK